jgi:GNAT superfamily N-acetyltransferase
MNPSVRRIRADEWPRLRALRLHALAEAPMAFGSTLAHEQAFPDDLWAERAAGGAAGCARATFIAEREEQWVGLATGLGRPDDPGDPGPLLIGMFVDRSVRRCGVAVALIESVTTWAQACGAARVSLWVTAGNEPAAALYRRCGFEPTGSSRPLAHTPALAEREMVRRL